MNIYILKSFLYLTIAGVLLANVKTFMPAESSLALMNLLWRLHSLQRSLFPTIIPPYQICPQHLSLIQLAIRRPIVTNVSYYLYHTSAMAAFVFATFTVPPIFQPAYPFIWFLFLYNSILLIIIWVADKM